MNPARIRQPLRVAVTAASLAAVFLGLAASATTGTFIPKAGSWNETFTKEVGGTGPSGQFNVTFLGFTVSADHKHVVHFFFSYSYSGPAKAPSGLCSGVATSTVKQASAIKNRMFATPGKASWTGGGSATFNGVFDSATKAHGTAKFSVHIGGAGCKLPGTVSTGTVAWRAMR